ncbi:hypothetical protein PS691_01924 [Pseudomonas fluorescens]|uniref:Uncharacterized protein n=1 Tax=Pseudomonas fluorescens TaxID=294 RepID=A0A5E7BHI2_PSEFL|nr:hypothetical protein PS691_01924 [Pseudomonas fluorescens]
MSFTEIDKDVQVNCVMVVTVPSKLMGVIHIQPLIPMGPKIYIAITCIDPSFVDTSNLSDFTAHD